MIFKRKTCELACQFLSSLPIIQSIQILLSYTNLLNKDTSNPNISYNKKIIMKVVEHYLDTI